MTMRDLIPWGRQTSSSAPSNYREGEVSPVFSLRREIDRLFDDVFRMPAFGLGSAGIGAWPSLEVADGDRQVRITAELPGLSEKDVELLVADGVLTIRGEKKSETGDRDRGWSERYYGRFERRLALPAGIQEDKAEAEFRDGVLTITLPKSPDAATSRRIPINGVTKH
jgi:HSP20 family protein